MKLSLLTNLYGDLTLGEMLDKITAAGIYTVEIGCGGYPGRAHCDPAALLADADAAEKFKAEFTSRGVTICALAVHGNPVHPDKKIAGAFDSDFRDACRLAGKIGVDTVITFSGCPGGSPADATPNWVTCPWPEDFLAVLDYQWNDVLIPYWRGAAAFAESAGVKRIAFEMHPGFCVYNPETLLRLRNAVGEVGSAGYIIGANFDPSHLIWQGIDPVAAVRVLAGAIYHFHAKDTRVDAINTAQNGVLDTKHYGDELNRSWIFRTVGYGNSEAYWRDLVSVLRLCGYDRVLSIEHEDSLMSRDEGLNKAVAFLRGVMISEPKPGSMHWA